MVSSVHPGDAAAFITQFRYSGGGGGWRGWVKNQSYSIKTLNDFLLQFFLCAFLKRLTSTSQLLFFLGRRFLLYMLRSFQYHTMNLCPPGFLAVFCSISEQPTFFLQPTGITGSIGFYYIIFTVLQCDLPPQWGGPGPRFEPGTGGL